MTNADRKDPQICNFIDKLNGIPYSESGYYYAFLNFKMSVIKKYSDNHVRFESDIKKRLRHHKEKQLRKVFTEEVMPYLDGLARKNKEELDRRRYNDNRNRKHKALKLKQNGNS